MWYRFPDGTDSITVQQQSFMAEVTDDAGHKYFRAPDHFAPNILMLKGFEVAERPEGAEEDTSTADVLRDGAISELGVVNGALRVEVENLRADLNSVSAQILALDTERKRLADEVAHLTDENEALRERIGEFEDVAATAAALASKTKKGKAD